MTSLRKRFIDDLPQRDVFYTIILIFRIFYQLNPLLAIGIKNLTYRLLYNMFFHCFFKYFLISDSFPILLQSLDKINYRANSIYNVREGGQVQPLLAH